MATDDNDTVERTTASVRVNKTGQPETVLKRKGKREEGTLSELDALASQLLKLIEGVEFANLPAMAFEQPNFQRTVNQQAPPQLVASRGDIPRASQETISNLEGTLDHVPTEEPENLRAKSPLQATMRGLLPSDKYRSDSGVGLDYGATQSEGYPGKRVVAPETVRRVADLLTDDPDGYS